MSENTDGLIKELGHLICGRFKIHPSFESQLFEKTMQDMLVCAIHKYASVFQYTYVNASYSQTPQEKEKNLPPLLIVYVEETPKPGELSHISHELHEAPPDDPFAQQFASRVIIPVAENIFGVEVEFIIGTKTPR